MKKSFLLFLVLGYNELFAQDVFTYLADFKEVAFYGFADSAGNTKTPGTYNLIMKPAEGLCRVWAGQKSSSDIPAFAMGLVCLMAPRSLHHGSPRPKIFRKGWPR